MHILDVITIISAGLMTGTELAVSAFVNPALQRLERGPQAQAVAIFARSLGRAMPVWYVSCFALLLVELFLHRHQGVFIPFVAATAIWALVILFSIAVLVPINNHIIASLSAAVPAVGWERELRKWELLHRVRILLLIVALFVFINAVVA
ncbi:MAG TPA: DUF1772 domain-containing protein [Bryobacteraceae bacterium]|jgi:uncharacterized membrane protein|nr:DUF1772 domain-containing protein [Bryobacteraceae bacterium]